ncbi:aminodeoxychorismate synthase component I, partial [Sinorhizobium meliloti]
MIEHAPYVLFRDDSENRTTVFAEPLRVITARTRAEFHRGLGEIDAAHRAGKWIAGFMAYEAGHLFEKKLASFAPENRETPLMSFGVFDAPAEA